MKLHSEKYKSYISSFDWYLKRRAALDRAQNRCEVCSITIGLQVHHKTYDRLGNEKPEDLMVLCEECHKIEDKKREEETQSRIYGARLDGWATKKYGEDWDLEMDQEDVAEEFDEWLDSKEEE